MISRSIRSRSLRGLALLAPLVPAAALGTSLLAPTDAHAVAAGPGIPVAQARAMGNGDRANPCAAHWHPDIDAGASAVAMSESAFESALRSGKGLDAIARAQGKDPAVVRRAVTASVRSAIQPAVAAGLITSADADRLSADHVAALVAGRNARWKPFAVTAKMCPPRPAAPASTPKAR